QREVIIYAFALPCIPFEKADNSASAAQMPSELGTCETNQVPLARVRVVRNDDFSTFPRDALQIGNWPLHIQPLAIRPVCLSDRAAPVVNAGDSNRKESRTFRVPIREPPKRECF